MQLDLENLRKIATDLELRKAEKRDIADVRQKYNNTINNKPDMSEIQSMLSNITSE